jgi:hypothetical protein
VVVGGSVIRDSDEPSNECPVGGYHEWEELRTALAHVCVLCGKVSAVRCFEHPVRQPLTPLHSSLHSQPQPPAVPPVAPVERQAS